MCYNESNSIHFSPLFLSSIAFWMRKATKWMEKSVLFLQFEYFYAFFDKKNRKYKHFFVCSLCSGLNHIWIGLLTIFIPFSANICIRIGHSFVFTYIGQFLFFSFLFLIHQNWDEKNRKIVVTFRAIYSR